MSSRRRVLVLVVLVALVVAGVLVVRAVLGDRGSGNRLDDALERVPAEALRVGFTDWAAIRRTTGVARTEDPERIETLVDKAFDADLSATSVLTEGASAEQQFLGFSPGNVDWEAIAHSPVGAAVVLRMADEVDLEDVRKVLDESGFRKPDSDDGVWRGGADLVAGLDPELGPQFQFVAVLDDEHTVVASDQARYAGRAAAVVRGDRTSLADADATSELTRSVRQPVVSAKLWSRDFACEDLALSTGGEEDAKEGDALVEQAGGVGPLAGVLMARLAGPTVVVVERYEEERRARADLEARARLAVGEAVGTGASYADDFELTSSRTDGANVVLTLRGRDGNTYLLSALQDGPVIFAAC